MKDIAEHILDITQNSISAKASEIKISIIESVSKNTYQLIIGDNGIGMDEELVKKVIDPFFTSRTTRKVGLGLPLLKQNVELTGGKFLIKSEVGIGTIVTAQFVNDSLDRLPSGDLAGTIVLLVASNPSLNFIYSHTTDNGLYVFDTKEIKEVLGNVPLTNSEVRLYLKEMIEENLEEIGND
jgi:Histidine kinase-, DNA gyrase B-, and HSP90-like ATPase